MGRSPCTTPTAAANTPAPGFNQDKLLALLLNPLAASHFGQFVQGERVYTTTGLFGVIDSVNVNNATHLLVRVNGTPTANPFYIIMTRPLNIINLPAQPNTIFEDLLLEYVGRQQFMQGGIPRETFVFRLVQ